VWILSIYIYIVESIVRQKKRKKGKNIMIFKVISTEKKISE
jgi:hypothetical protein